MNQMKFCVKCRESKPISSFGIHPITKKRAKFCKGCNRLWKEARHLEAKENAPSPH